MKKLFLMFSILFLSIISFNSVFAYTVEDVSTHSTASDCWMIYDSNVYDITSYLRSHDRFMDIESWCGEDMTVDFETKAGSGVDHKSSTYSLLEQFKIGSVDGEVDIILDTSSQTDTIVEKKDNNPYNIIIPTLLSILLYWGSYFIYGKKHLKGFNGFWNTLLLLTLLIPSFGFGIYMILRYQFVNLWNIQFDFMYWHVELSIVMGILGISHLVQRLKVYLLQIRLK